MSPVMSKYRARTLRPAEKPAVACLQRFISGPTLASIDKEEGITAVFRNNIVPTDQKDVAAGIPEV
jgi:hypothetical protein